MKHPYFVPDTVQEDKTEDASTASENGSVSTGWRIKP